MKSYIITGIIILLVIASLWLFVDNELWAKDQKMLATIFLAGGWFYFIYLGEKYTNGNRNTKKNIPN